MVPLRMRKNPRRPLGSRQEPLLDVFQNEWLPPGEQSHRHRRRQTHMHTHEHRLSPSTNYEAPIVVGVIPQQQGQFHTELPYLDGSHGRSLVHHIHHNLLEQTNPAEYLSIPLCSYGELCCQCVHTQEIGITENFGAFDLLLEPGLYILCWPYSTIAARMSLRIQQLDVVCETKTKDNVFVHIQISIQYKVIAEMAYFAHYRLEDPRQQIRSYVFDVVRAQVPLMEVDQVFLSKHEIADEIQSRLRLVMSDYGYEICNSLCTNVTPTHSVKRAMTEVEACRREKLAMPYRAEANKISRIKKAEAHAQSTYLQGVGTANQRMHIVKGLKESAENWGTEQNLEFSHVMDILLLTQYMDMLAHVGANSLILRPAPGEVADIRQGLKYGADDDDESSQTSSVEEVVEGEEGFEVEAIPDYL